MQSEKTHVDDKHNVANGVHGISSLGLPPIVAVLSMRVEVILSATL